MLIIAGMTISLDGYADDRNRIVPSAGPPPWNLDEFTPTIAFGVATAEPHGATRWRFSR